MPLKTAEWLCNSQETQKPSCFGNVRWLVSRQNSLSENYLTDSIQVKC